MTVVTATGKASAIAANCPNGRLATGGGGSRGGGTAVLTASVPIFNETTGQPTGWRVIFSEAPPPAFNHTAYVICAG